ncbi:MAG: LamG domain-containing protein, partial [Armatimonadetes bacterium]|nr:LamG domain-containing protein [Armatimonadota bacterium]
MTVTVWIVALSLRGLCSAEGSEAGLVASYSFDEGRGELARDTSGHGHHGQIRGARYVRCGKGWALRLDGVNDYVDCGDPPALRLSSGVSLEAWVYPEAVPVVGEAGILGKDYGSYVLTYYQDGQCWWYISGGGNNCKAPLSAGAWHHVVGTFDGQFLRLYIDGRLAATRASSSARIGAGGRFLIGTSGGDPQYTRGAHFKGL